MQPSLKLSQRSGITRANIGRATLKVVRVRRAPDGAINDSGIRLSEIQTIVLPRLTYSLLQYTSFDCIPLYVIPQQSALLLGFIDSQGNFTLNVGLKALGFTSEMKIRPILRQRSTANIRS
jgi:hypothetical protein